MLPACLGNLPTSSLRFKLVDLQAKLALGLNVELMVFYAPSLSFNKSIYVPNRGLQLIFTAKIIISAMMFGNSGASDRGSSEKLLSGGDDESWESSSETTAQLIRRHKASLWTHLGHLVVELALLFVILDQSLSFKDRCISSSQLLYSTQTFTWTVLALK